ncbi:hypothetical protein HMPREF0322_05258 [Desulfitobacterium hafniense DP7]|uniref:Uncharacterized protein n=1 Tax=Desulfitobacterium hafniense DP7 TaxID=537010 RepID=G9XW91_DESHA|nr:hypothetical protein [Desulfitobacterium hafniense]EHL04106.1 hypothetical protein HMPREF0322_05258 [Desulfitobacterium hafniense DP7]
MDNEKFQDLMLEHFGKVLNELTGMKTELTEVKQDVAGIKAELTEVKQDVTGIKAELTEVKQDVAGMKVELAGVKQDVTGLKESQTRMETDLVVLRQSQVRMEQDFGRKLDILFYDWRETQKQFNEEVKSEIKILGTKVEALQMESSKHDREIKDLYLVNLAKGKSKD